MAKLNAPLFSFRASGSLAKSLVYFGWKGLNVVRSYVVPANPKTTLQVAQRGHMTATVALIHAAQAQTPALDETDQSAYALLASIIQRATTWFNQAVRDGVDRRVAALTHIVFRAGKTTPGADKLDVEVYSWQAAVNTGVFKYGTSKTNLINSQAATVVGTKYSAALTGLVTGVKYYWQFVAATPGTLALAHSGIYYGVAA